MARVAELEAERDALKAEVARLREAVQVRDACQSGAQEAFGASAVYPYCRRGASAGEISHKADCPTVTHPAEKGE
jgi:hypothetical protein